MDIDALKEWFLSSRRPLPWRKESTPYKVWISEVMLQQTRAEVVSGYFERWMERFPSINALAAASKEEVIKQWEGLGYYSRARYLHENAQYLVEHHKGELAPAVLSELKGLGPYTIGAILSFAFHQKAAAIDGNVERVMARFYLWEEEISSTLSRSWLTKAVGVLLPDKEPWIIMEALIELGALVCQKEPKCSLCPLRSSCQGYREGKVYSLPKKRQKRPSIKLTRWAHLIVHGREVLVRKGEEGKVMADLYEFPYCEGEYVNFLENELGLQVVLQKILPEIKHTFTRYRVTLIPMLWRALCKIVLQGYEWKCLDEIDTLPFSSGHRRIKDAYFAH